MNLTIEEARAKALQVFQEGEPAGRTAILQIFGREIIPASPMEWVKGFADICYLAGKDPADYETDSTDPSMIRAQAARKCWLINEVLVGEWVPDFTNSKQRKYEIYWKPSASGVGFSYGVCGCVSTYSCVGSRLSWPDAETGRFAAETFETEFNTFLF